MTSNLDHKQQFRFKRSAHTYLRSSNTVLHCRLSSPGVAWPPVRPFPNTLTPNQPLSRRCHPSTRAQIRVDPAHRTMSVLGIKRLKKGLGCQNRDWNLYEMGSAMHVLQTRSSESSQPCRQNNPPAVKYSLTEDNQSWWYPYHILRAMIDLSPKPG